MERTAGMLARGFTVLAWLILLGGAAITGVGTVATFGIYLGWETWMIAAVWIAWSSFWTAVWFTVFMFFSLVSEYIGSQVEAGGQ